jgi:tetratricopeptide (TPR) repeat protein
MNAWQFLKHLFQSGNSKGDAEKTVTRLVELAFSLLQGGNYVEAQGLLLRALEYKSEIQNPVLLEWILTSLSKTWKETEEYQKWAEFFSALIAQNPNQAIAYHLRAESHWYGGSLSDAIADYSRALELNPKDVSAFLGRGQVFMECRDFSRALADLDAALGSIDSVPGADAAWKAEF